jgi:NAD(P)-dependent dehydrogenase (short-subunit alcohol dehydrogenase family)
VPLNHTLELLDRPVTSESGLRLKNVMPGFIEPEEIAAAIAYLASDDARSVTGASLVVDRGMLC